MEENNNNVQNVEQPVTPVEPVQQEVQPVVPETNGPLPVVNPMPQKPKKSKKGLIITIVIIALLAVGGLTTWLIMSNSGDSDTDEPDTEEKEEKKDNKKDKDEDIPDEKETKDDSAKYDEKTIYFYEKDGQIKFVSAEFDKMMNTQSTIDDKEIIAKYECSNDKCYLHVPVIDYSSIAGVMNNKKAFIGDESKDGTNAKIVLFDVSSNKVVGEYSKPALLIRDNYGEESEYILVKKINGDMFGVIDLDGNVIKNYNIDIPDKFLNDTEHRLFSKSGNYIINSKNGKYGITRITSDEVVVDYLYEDISIIDANSYKALLNGEWTTYTFDK